LILVSSPLVLVSLALVGLLWQVQHKLERGLDFLLFLLALLWLR
jgi:hypothetical protein